MEVAACNTPTSNPAKSAAAKIGKATLVVTIRDSIAISITNEVSICYLYLMNVETNELVIRPQPSTNTKSSSLNGSEIIIGDSIIIPIDMRTLATTRSIMMNGM